MEYSSQWKEIKDLFHRALKLPLEERDAFVAKQTGKDKDRFNQVMNLLNSDSEASSDDFMKQESHAEDGVDAIRELMKEHPRYQLEELLGEGGMASVYLAKDSRLQRKVALKFLKREDEDLTRRFAREAKAQAKVEHENICQIYETDQWKGRSFIAMQYLPGEHLTDYLEKESIERKVQMIADVASALHAAHSVGLIHRDLKPSNIIVVLKNGEPKPFLTDFGIAVDIGDVRKTRTNTLAGTPAFMAPEQIKGETATIDRRTDVYGLGATLYVTLVGELPFDGDTSIQVMFNALEREPLPLRHIMPKTPKDLEIITLKCLEKDQHQRYPTAKALAEDLNRFLQGDPIQGKRTSVYYRLKKRILKHRFTVAVVGLALILALSFGIMNVRSRIQSKHQLQWVQRFGQEISTIEHAMSMAYLYPIHDLTQDREDSTKRLNWISEQISTTGGLVAGPGHFALGRGYLTLGRLEAAAKQFQKAREIEYEHQDLDYFQSRALGLLYLEKLDHARDISNPAVRSSEIAKVKRLYRTPAVNLLSGLRPFDHELDRIFYDFLSEKDTSGYELPGQDELFDQQSYEQYLMWTSIVLDQARGHRSLGEKTKAKLLLKTCADFLDRISKIGRSNPAVFFQIAQVNLELMKAAAKHGEDPDHHFNFVFQNLNKAIQTDPLNPRYLELMLSADYLRMHFRMFKSLDYKTIFETALEHAVELSKLDGGEIQAHYHKARILQLYGRAENDRGQEAEPYFKEALKHLDKVLETQSESAHGLALKATILESYATLLETQDRDSMPMYKEIVQIFELLSQSNTKSDMLLQQLGNAQFRLAYGMGERNRSGAIALLRTALVTLEKAKEINAHNFYTWNGLGMTKGVLGNMLLRNGEDPKELFLGSLKAFEETLRVYPDLPYSISNTGLAYHDLWRLGYIQGTDPLEPYLLGIKQYERTLEIMPGFGSAIVGALDFHLDELQRRLINGGESKKLIQTIQDWMNRFKAQCKKEPPAKIIARFKLLKTFHSAREDQAGTTEETSHVTLNHDETSGLFKSTMDSESARVIALYFWLIRESASKDLALRNRYKTWLADQMEHPEHDALVALGYYLDPSTRTEAKRFFSKALQNDRTLRIEYDFLYQDSEMRD